MNRTPVSLALIAFGLALLSGCSSTAKGTETDQNAPASAHGSPTVSGVVDGVPLETTHILARLNHDEKNQPYITLEFYDVPRTCADRDIPSGAFTYLDVKIIPQGGKTYTVIDADQRSAVGGEAEADFNSLTADRHQRAATTAKSGTITLDQFESGHDAVGSVDIVFDGGKIYGAFTTPLCPAL
jgi:hypothetical protein